MIVSRLADELPQHIGQFAVALLSWILVFPLTLLLSRDRSLAIVYGREQGKFVDNCKHLYCACASLTELRTVCIVSDRHTMQAIERLGGNAVASGSAAEFRLWLRAGTVFVDSAEWTHGYRYAASQGARVVQLWHGIPLKLVELALERKRRIRPFPLNCVYGLFRRIRGRRVRTEWLLSTSRFVTERAFGKSFEFRNVSHAGYPRNDALFANTLPLVRVNIDHRVSTIIDRHRASNGKVGIYAPTFREARSDPFADDSVDLPALSQAAARLDLLLLIKLHPAMHGRLRSTELANLAFVEPDSDAYPLLPLTDFLITDYSSIFFDYLLLDRPVLFFPYDLEHYLAREREMYFDYGEMTPGPKSFDVQELAGAMADAVGGVDSWQAERARVRDLVFDYQDGKAAKRLLDELFPGEPARKVRKE